MIVDFHAHIVAESWLSDYAWEVLRNSYDDRTGMCLFRQELSVEDLVEELCDPKGERLLQSMDRAGIDRSVVLALDWGVLFGDGTTPVAEQHDRLAHIAQNSGGRIIPFVGVDPRRNEASELIDYCLDKLGMQGIKLYPATGYDLHDSRYSFIFNSARKFNVPILMHTGFSFGPMIAKYCDVAMLDYLCATYEDVTFVAAHLGAGQLEQFAWLGYAKPNLYADCSMMQVNARHNTIRFATDLRIACDLMGSSRIVFGSDWPFTERAMSTEEFVAVFQNLNSIDQSVSRFANCEVKQILGRNAECLISSKNHID